MRKQVLIAGLAEDALDRFLRLPGNPELDHRDGCVPKAYDLVICSDDEIWIAEINRLRKAGSRMPILVITRQPGSLHRIRALQAGADDAVSSPIDTGELSLRAARFLRSEPELVIGKLVLDPVQRMAWREGRDLCLLPREFELLHFLASHGGQPVSRRTLLARVWRLNDDPGTNVIEVHVSRLRNKLDRPFAAPMLTTVKGIGYVLDPMPQNNLPARGLEEDRCSLIAPML